MGGITPGRTGSGNATTPGRTLAPVCLPLGLCIGPFCIGGACVYLCGLLVRMRAGVLICVSVFVWASASMTPVRWQRVMPTPEIILVQQTFQRVGSVTSARRGIGGGGGGGGSGNNTARSGQFYAGQDPAIIASKAVEERVRRLEIQVNNFDKGMAKCLSQIVRLLQGLY